MADAVPIPTDIRLHKKSRRLQIDFDDRSFSLSCEYLRVFSPSAEVRGHGPGQGVLQHGKETVNINMIEPVGNYAVKLHFDDGHDTGIYSWAYLYELGIREKANWNTYLAALQEAGHARRGPK